MEEKKVTGISEFLLLLVKNRTAKVSQGGFEVVAHVVNGRPGTQDSDISLQYRRLDNKSEGATIIAYGVLKWVLTSKRQDAKAYRGSDPQLVQKLVNIIHNVDKNRVKWNRLQTQR